MKIIRGGQLRRACGLADKSPGNETGTETWSRHERIIFLGEKEMSKFLADQFKQLLQFFKSYKEDIARLHDIVTAWEESGTDAIDKLEEEIKNGVKNSAGIEVKIDESGNYLMSMLFKPIQIVWILRKK